MATPSGTFYEGPPAPSGFSFQPGELIPLGPDVFPGEAQLIMLSEMAMAYGGPLLIIGALLITILEIINLLVLIFSGKPRAMDTITVAHRLSQSLNPAGHIASVLILRELREEDVVLSAGDPHGMERVNNTRHQLVMSLVAQGTPITRAKTLAGNIWGNTTGPTEPLPKELMQQMDPKFTLLGTKATQDIYVQRYNEEILKGKDPLVAALKAQNDVYNHAKIKDLLQIQTKLRPSGPPPPPPTCPPGQHFDQATQMCVADSTIPPPPPPDPQGDELTECCNLTATYLYFIATAIQGFTPTGMDPTCCTNVVAAINSVADALKNASDGGPGAINVTVDTTAIAAAIAKLSIPPPVVNVLVNAPETDDPNVKRIADAAVDFDNLSETQERRWLAYIDYLEQQGTLDSAVAQVLKS